MSELSEKAMRLMVASHTMNNFDMWKTLYDYIAGLEDENCSLGESNLWLKQNYENLERDYGVMHGKMCLRIDELRARIAELEKEIDVRKEHADKLLKNIEKLDAIGQRQFKRIGEIEAKNTMLKQLSQPIEFWSDEKIQIYKNNESRTMKSGNEEREE